MSYDTQVELDNQDGWQLEQMENEAYQTLLMLDAEARRRVLERLEKAEPQVETRNLLPVSF